MKLWQIIGTTSVTKEQIRQTRVCEFCRANLINRSDVDIRDFVCIAPKQEIVFLTHLEDEKRFHITEPCLKDDQPHCFIWFDNQKEAK